MPTCGRQKALGETLRALAAQTRPPDKVVIVDNEASSETMAVIDHFRSEPSSFEVELVDAPENLGSAGGWALAIEVALPQAQDQDWLVTLDDDDPPIYNDELEKIFQFAQLQKRQHPKTAGVGISGARFDWRRGFLKRLPDSELSGDVEVDYIANGHVAMYSVAVVKEQGGFRGELFFGQTEVEYCLRLRSIGYRFFAQGELWRRRRIYAGRLATVVRPNRMCSDAWKKYYSIRNHIFIMLQFRRVDLALKLAFIQVFLKPLYTLPRDPGLAYRGFRLAFRAVKDGFCKNMGKTLLPNNFRVK